MPATLTTHTIHVTVGTDVIEVEPSTLTMSSRDAVQWAGGNARAFSIVFDDAGPFESRELPHSAAIQAQQPRTRGRFKYTVVSADDPELRLDPVIIVEEPPTGNEP